MTTDVLWMSETWFKDNSTVNDNVDWKIIQPIMIDVQNMYIHPILGTDLFDEIANQINTNTVSSLNQTLLNLYVKRCILNYVLSELAPALKHRYQNKGVMVRSSENSQPANLEEIQFEISRWKQKAEWYGQRITDYLIEHNIDYPLFYNGNNEGDTIKPLKNNFTSSLYLGGDDCGCDPDRKYK